MWVKLERAMAGDLAHSYAARQEAGSKLRSNHERVLRDVTNPGPLNIDGKPLTQLRLSRVPESQIEFADAALREIEARLLGEERSEPHSTEEAMIWAATAQYLTGRI